MLALRDKVGFVADEGRRIESASLEVAFADGTTEHAATTAFGGSPANPLSDDDLQEKFTGCAAGAIDPDRVEAITTAITGIHPALGADDFAALLVR